MAIAEVCGWVWYRLPEKPWKDARRYRCLFLPAVHEYEGQSPEWLVRSDGTETICNWQYMQREGSVPNYTGSLDAMYEAEKVLEGMLIRGFRAKGIYENILRSLVGGESLWHATSAQKAEAFLRAAGRWQEKGEKQKGTP